MKTTTAPASSLRSAARRLAAPRSFRPLPLLRPTAALAAAAILALFSVEATATGCRPFTGKGEAVLVNEVVDGDSLVLQDGTEVRIIGINATEIWGDPHPAPYSRSARRHTRRLLRGSGNRIYLYPGDERHDRYGRSLAHVVLENGRDLGEELLLAGLAAAVFFPPNTYRAECYRRAERLARSHHRGLWSHRDPFQRRFQVIEGKIGHFQRGQGSLVVYIGARKLPVSIITTHWQPDAKEFNLSNLYGRKVRASGWLNRRGHLIVRHPLAFEFLDGKKP